MELHESLAELVAHAGPHVLEDPDGFRAALDDYLDEGAATTGDINLLVDAVRLGAFAWMSSTLASGGEGAKAVAAAGELLARDRGSRDLDSARWACAVLAFAVGKVGDADVRCYRPASTGSPGSPGSTVSLTPPWEQSTEPVPPPGSGSSAPAPGRPTPNEPTTQAGPPTQVVPAATSGRSAELAGTSEKRSGLKAPLAALAVLVVIGGAAAGYVTLRGDDDPGVSAGPAADATDTTGTAGATASTRTPSNPESPVESEAPSESGEPDPLPFKVAADFINQPCNGEVVVMLATAGVSDRYADKLGKAVDGVTGAKVLRASDSCEAFEDTHPESGQAIYNAYLGPFATVPEACQMIATLDSPTAWVRKLTNPSQERELCFCEQSVDALPVIGPDTDTESLDVRRLIGQVQWGLYLMGVIGKEDVFTTYGSYTSDFMSSLEEFQAEVAIDESGSVDSPTWEELQTRFCDTTEFDKER